jgi:hypothetical protein
MVTLSHPRKSETSQIQTTLQTLCRSARLFQAMRMSAHWCHGRVPGLEFPLVSTDCSCSAFCAQCHTVNIESRRVKISKELSVRTLQLESPEKLPKTHQFSNRARAQGKLKIHDSLSSTVLLLCACLIMSTGLPFFGGARILRKPREAFLLFGDRRVQPQQVQTFVSKNGLSFQNSAKWRKHRVNQGET